MDQILSVDPVLDSVSPGPVDANSIVDPVGSVDAVDAV